MKPEDSLPCSQEAAIGEYFEPDESIEPETKRTHGIPRQRCEENTKVYLKEMLCYNVDWVHFAHSSVQTSDLYERKGIATVLKACKFE
jgi:hypothetical protein